MPGSRDVAEPAFRFVERREKTNTHHGTPLDIMEMSGIVRVNERFDQTWCLCFSPRNERAFSNRTWGGCKTTLPSTNRRPDRKVG